MLFVPRQALWKLVASNLYEQIIQDSIISSAHVAVFPFTQHSTTNREWAVKIMRQVDWDFGWMPDTAHPTYSNSNIFPLVQ